MPNGIICVFLVCLFTVFDHDWLKMTYVRRPVAENSETRASNSHPIVSWLEWNRREGKTFARSNEKKPEMRNWPNLYYNGLVSNSIHFSRRNAMATTTTPEVGTPAKTPVTLTPTAVSKVREIMTQQNPVPAGLRIGVVGGGCSGFSYSMSFENAPGMMDKVLNFDGLKVYVDATSAMYLDGCTVDFVETLEASGFKFENPNVKSTCGCGSSFNV